MKRIATIVAFDKFTDVDVYLIWDLLNRVRLRDKDWSVKIIGIESHHSSLFGIRQEMQGTIDQCNTADVVFFTSGQTTRRLIKGNDYLKRFSLNPEKQIIASICSGALLLAALGLLDGKTATTYPTAVDALKSYGIEVEDKPLVTHGNVATAAGCLAAIDLVSWIISKTHGAEIKNDVIASIQPVGQGLECIN
jgi:transcriptional regulator GlxA family with amidase domain